jgi:hypothetical protein
VNEKDAFNISSEENRNRYIEYLKLMNDLLPCSAFQSLFFQREVISKYGALV